MPRQPELIPFHCPKHGWRLDAVPSATVECTHQTCGLKCLPPAEFFEVRQKALNARRMRRQRNGAKV